jgi:hypothetical protein
VDVSGLWTFSGDVAGPAPGTTGVSCLIRDRAVTFTQSGATFTGSWSGGTVFCTANGVTQGGAASSGTVASGTISGNSVSFNFDTPDFANNGSISGSTVGGTTTLRIPFGTSSVLALGSFSLVHR